MVIAGVALIVWRVQEAAAAEAVGAGSFSRRCEVVGTTAPGPQGPLTAPESGRQVVWHRSEAIEHYRDTERDSKGSERSVEKQRTVAWHASEDPFVVRDGCGEIVVDPRGANVDQAPVIASRFEQEPDRGGMLADIFTSEGDRTTGIERKEWASRPTLASTCWRRRPIAAAGWRWPSRTTAGS